MGVIHHNMVMLDTAPEPGPFSGRTLLIRAGDTRSRIKAPHLGRNDKCDKIKMIDVPFEHLRLLTDEEPTLQITSEISDWL